MNLQLCIKFTTLLGSIWAVSAPSSFAMASPPAHYVSIVHEVDVAQPAGSVWKKIGRYCDLSKWLGKSCQIVGGQDGQVGAVRLVDNQITEILVGRTATSYTYSQPDMPNAQTHFYHGTLDVEPQGHGASKIVYTLFYDVSAITDPTARAKELSDRSALFDKAVHNMKRIAEASNDRQ